MCKIEIFFFQKSINYWKIFSKNDLQFRMQIKTVTEDFVENRNFIISMKSGEIVIKIDQHYIA